MRLSRSAVVLVASTAAVSAIVLVAFAQQAPRPVQTWTPERLHAWVVEEFQGEPDVAALIRDVVATYGDLYDAWNEAKGEGDPAVKAVEERRDRLMAKYLALWDERREEIRRRAPARVKARDANPLVFEARIQGLFKISPPVRDLVWAIVAVDRDIDRLEAAGRDRRDPAFKAARDLRSDLTARYDALWKGRYDELRRRVLANDKDEAPADLESKVEGEFFHEYALQMLTRELQATDREVLEARKAGRDRGDPNLKALERRQAELWASYDAAWRGRYDEFRRRALAGTDAFASWRVGASVGDLFRRAPEVLALDEQRAAIDREMARTLDPVPTRRDEAAREAFERRKAELSAKHNALWTERYPALYKQAVAELQNKFTPKPETPAVAEEKGRASNAKSPLMKMGFTPGGPEPYFFAPIPKTIATHVSGTARDDRNRPIAGAEVTLHAVTQSPSLGLTAFVASDEGAKAKPAATTTTDAEGRYNFRGVRLPVLTSFKSGADYNPPPMIRFLVSAEAPGKGIAWGRRSSGWQYNWQNVEANGAEVHPFLQTDVTIDLKFRNAAILQGQVVDGHGEPIHGASVRVVDFAEFGPDGRETNDVQKFDAESFPDGVGHCRTGADGGFRIEGLAEAACYTLSVTHPDSPRGEFKLYATTLEGPDQTHEPFFSTHGGRGRHEARTSPITITLPELRPIEVHVAAKDDGRPVAGADLKFAIAAPPFMYIATGASDAEGKLRLNAPPGRLLLLVSNPPEGSRFLRTYLQPVQIDPGDAPFTIEVPQEVGAELVIEAVEAGTGKPMADVFFAWTLEAALVEQPRTANDVSTVLPKAWTNEKGVLRVAVAPAPGRRYRFHFDAMREPVTTSLNPDRSQTYGYEASPAQSEPVELVAGKPVHLRFELRKGTPDPNPQRRRQGVPPPARRGAAPPRISSR